MRVRVRVVDTVPVPVGIGSDAPANNVSQTKSSILRVAPLTTRSIFDRDVRLLSRSEAGSRLLRWPGEASPTTKLACLER